MSTLALTLAFILAILVRDSQIVRAKLSVRSILFGRPFLRHEMVPSLELCTLYIEFVTFAVLYEINIVHIWLPSFGKQLKVKTEYFNAQ